MTGTKGHSGTSPGSRGRHKGFHHSQETKDKIREKCRNCPVVHHIDGNHFNNAPENRMIVTPREHAIIHMLQGDIKPYGGGRNHNKICESGRINKNGKRNEKTN